MMRALKNSRQDMQAGVRWSNGERGSHESYREARDSGVQPVSHLSLDDQEYGPELFKIQEIRGYSPVTSSPNISANVRGVV
jgi:chemotaxis signal transduction protein